MKQLLIICLACLMPVLLVIYIDKKDKYKREPKKEIWKAFGYGVLVALVCLVVEIVFALIGIAGTEYSTFGGAVWSAFMGAALPEESLKLLFLLLFIRRCRYFDENMDGIVYAVAIGMGFAAFENLVYLYSNLAHWQSTAIIRSFMAVPCHYICAVIMGYYCSLAHFKEQKKDKWLMFLIPFLFHGMYDSFLFVMRVNGDTILILMLLVLALLVCFMLQTRKVISAHLKRDLEEYILSVTPPDIVCTDEKETSKEE